MEKHVFTVQAEGGGERLDKALVAHFPERTREFFRRLTLDGYVIVSGKKALKPALVLKEGDTVQVVFPSAVEMEVKPKNMKLDVVYEDDDVLLLNKPAGIAVHPGHGGAHLEDSLVSGILYHCKGELSGINGVMRPGIVHRLDKDTSGLLAVAKNDKAHQALARQFEERTVEKEYMALLAGRLEPLKGTIDSPIGRDTRDRKRMAVVSERLGKSALTKYEVEHYYHFGKKELTLVKVRLLTGRTHQIRVHFAALGFPLVGDNLYGYHELNKKFEQKFGLTRQFLHAVSLRFELPSACLTRKKGKKKVSFTAPLPSDLDTVLKGLTLDVA